MTSQQQVQGIQNIDKHPFQSNQQTISHNPDKFILDFQSVFPQFNPDSQPMMVMNHRIILLDPYYAKSFLNTLSDNLSKYEKKFGEIKKSEQIEKAEKEFKNIQEITKSEEQGLWPSYVG